MIDGGGRGQRIHNGCDRDASGTVRGRVREVAIIPEDDLTRIAYLIVRTSGGERVLPIHAVTACGATVRADTDAGTWDRHTPSDGVLLLKTPNTDTQGGTGSGAVQNYTVYGQVAPVSSPAAGAYTDTIAVTVTY